MSDERQDDYLWDRSGPPDPEIQRLEQVLSTLRFDRPLKPVAVRRRWSRRLRGGFAVAAMIGAIAVAVPVFKRTGRSSWEVAWNDGQAVSRLRTGEWLHTNDQQHARLKVANIGRVDVAPGSRLRLKGTGPDEHRLELTKGKIDAFITAPPRLFFVETPAAVAADLGCAYTLEVDAQENGLLHVTLGWVELDSGERTVLVPAASQCEMRKEHGVGTPHFSDAPTALRTALTRFDFDDDGAAALDDVLAAARSSDTLTLWYVLPRAPEAQRWRIYDTLAAQSPPPPGVTREAVLRLDPQALAAWQEKLRGLWW